MRIGWVGLMLVLPTIGFSQAGGISRADTANIGELKESELCNVCSVPVWIVLNEVGTSYFPSRKLFLVMGAADFTEANLATVFTEFATQFPEPVGLIITAFSDRAMLERLIKADPAGYLDFADTPEGKEARKQNEERYRPKTGFFRAYYFRSGSGKESFQYNPNPDVDNLVGVTLKQRTDENYAGDLKSDLLLAASKGDLSKIRELLAQGADVNSKDFQGETPLHKAKNLETVEALLSHAAAVDDRNNYGFTPLIRAASLARSTVVQALIGKGAAINAKNKYGNTALMSAAMIGCVEVVEILLRSGADPRATNNLGKTAMMFARSKGHMTVVHQLEAAGIQR